MLFVQTSMFSNYVVIGVGLYFLCYLLWRVVMKTPEDEEFNRIEMESRIKQEYVRAMKPQSVAMPDYLHLMEELSVARILIRELGDRLVKLEKPWGGLTDEEYQELLVEHNEGGLILFYNLVEAKLRSKNA
jgi:hypothetical protein